MRADKNTKGNAIVEALQKVKDTMARIDGEKDKLRVELAAVEKEIERRIAGKPSITLGKFGFSKSADFYYSDEEIARKRAKLKNALDIPYYADEEYRKYSLAYIELITSEAIAEYDDLEKRKEENRELMRTYRRNVDALKMEHHDISGKIATKYIDIGLGKFASGLMFGAPYSNYINYKEYCEKYE